MPHVGGNASVTIRDRHIYNDEGRPLHQGQRVGYRDHRGAILPATFVDHTHVDALISVMNTPNGSKRLREFCTERIVMILYLMSGFKLAK